MCVLMLRGPQTLGELKDRGARFYEFSNLEEVDETLNKLSSMEPYPLVVRLSRQAGQKEARVAHLLGGEVKVEALSEAESPRRVSRANEAERVSVLEQQVEALRAEVNTLQQQFVEFKKQFE